MTLRTLLAACLSMSVSAEVAVVHTNGGRVSGVAGSAPEVRVYKGIPYAAAPTGDRRWRAPEPAAPWDGVRDASQFSPTCPQQPYPENSIYRSAPQPSSEDCLYLNVWTAAGSAKERRPVMVWIHGGALTRGSGSTRTYDGESLARKGVVVVTINYRLGIFGFLAHPELTTESPHRASGNYGLLDQIAALEWVQKNIAAFGGDPKRVTIFGESAGSWSVNYLMASPRARGLFHRAIGQSGGAFSVLSKLSAAEQAGAKVAAGLGAASLKELRAKSVEELLKAPAGGRPNVDGWLLSEDVYTIFASGKQNDVPLIAGFNADEATAFTPWPPGATAATYTEQMRRRYPRNAEEWLKHYPAGSDEEARQSFYAVFRDLTFGWHMRTWVRLATKTGKSKAYYYYFTRVPPGPSSKRLGAYHAAEIAYVFHNLHTSPRPWEPADHQLSDTLSSYWVNFAATGDPNGKGLPQWPAYDASGDIALELGTTITQRPNLHKAVLDFLDGHFHSLRLSQ